MLELPVPLLGRWCNPVRWQHDNNLLIYTRSSCWRGDNFLQIEPRRMTTPRANCEVEKVFQVGDGRWNRGTEMVFNVWLQCDGWRQKLTVVENRWLRLSSDWVEYPAGYTGPGRTIIRW